MQQVTTVGLDIAKNLFQVHGADAQGRPVLKRRLAREKVLEFFANLPACLVGLEACARRPLLGARAGQARPHRPADAAAVRPALREDEQARRGRRRGLLRGGAAARHAVRAGEGARSQQALLMLHRVREQLLKQRTATINALRAHLAEFGIVAAQRRTGLRELLAVVADPEDRRLPPLARELLQGLVEHLRALEERTAELDRRLVAAARDGGACERLAAVPGIGPVIATALVAAIGDAKAFTSGRHLAAWLGLVPRQHSSGGKERLLGISKRGDGYLRRQLMHGARALVAVSQGPGGRALGLDRRAAGAAAVQRRRGGGREQAGADRLGAAQPRRGLPRGGGVSDGFGRAGRPGARPERADPSLKGFHGLRGRQSRMA